jgi:hypothetical protein
MNEEDKKRFARYRPGYIEPPAPPEETPPDQETTGEASPELGDLAQSLMGDGKYVEAERIFREVLGVYRKVFGKEHRQTLTVAANYGGRWDIMQATRKMLSQRPESAHSFEEEDLMPHFAMSYAPEPDLFIRTGGEKRISNFLLWQLAYTELYFTDTLWPDFDARALDLAIESYQQRERRFGRTSEQIEVSSSTEGARRFEATEQA